MARKIEVCGKTIDEAIEKGLIELGLEREEVSVEVLENPKSGFLGIGATPAKILMKVFSENGDDDDEEEIVPVKEEPVKKEKKEKKAVAGTCDSARAKEFLNEVLSYICADAHVEEKEGEEGFISLEIVGSDLGGVIGRRGETLDALQHLTSLVCNRKSEGKKRIALDAENYREKRSESLDRFARRAAGQVLKYKRNKALEPMNAYERHIVHVALQDMENISTSSVGVEPMRRVIINYTGLDARPSGRSHR
ncbi:MAG: protein jag [Oscillospiraceae bacterium]|nr:protein jag [Oscillospiraceae bacterium]